MEMNRRNKGFTLAEVLIVIGILAVLFAVIAVSVVTYLRSMTKLEYDGFAKELFIAAQNHLSSAKSEDYLGITGAGIGIEEPSSVTDHQDGAYYFVVNTSGGTSPDSDGTVLSLMLPFGSVDDPVRLGGCYIVRYHKDSGQVLDVFYWSGSGRYPHAFTSDDYAEFLANRDDSALLRKWTDNSVIGYFGGVNAEDLTFAPGAELTAPSITVVNGDRLYVSVRDTNSSSTAGTNVKLIVKGTVSKAQKEFEAEVGGSKEIVLDDITAYDSITNKCSHFADIFPGFLPGEDIEIYAVASNNTVFTNVAYSSIQTTNSLFGEGTSFTESVVGEVTYHVGNAKIGSFRHLENLAGAVSGVKGSLLDVKFTSAEQTTDLDWNLFMGGSSSVQVYPASGSPTSAGYFLPVRPVDGFVYDGCGCTISNVAAKGVKLGDSNEAAGLFSSLKEGEVKNLRLKDFSIDAAGTNGFAGSLVGSATGTKLTNIVSYGSGSSVRGSSYTGGLVGQMGGGAILKCAASVIVESTGANAGGLIGHVTAGTTVTACYSGGHTTGGKYDGVSFDVSGSGAAGGLIGCFGGSRIEFSYSTCSVTGTSGSAVGGLVGTVTSSCAIDRCYSTGLVRAEGASGTVGAFVGSAGSAELSGCKYFMIVNERTDFDGKVYYLAPLGVGSSSGLTAFDRDEESFELFVGAKAGWKKAHPYDGTLHSYYSGLFPLNTVVKLGCTDVSDSDFVSDHYGDWPAPEVFLINR